MELIGGFAGFLFAQYLFTFVYAASISGEVPVTIDHWGVYGSPPWWVWVLDVLVVTMGILAGITCMCLFLTQIIFISTNSLSKYYRFHIFSVVLKRIYPKYYSLEIITSFLGTSNMLAASCSKFGEKFFYQCDLYAPDSNSWWDHCGHIWVPTWLLMFSSHYLQVFSPLSQIFHRSSILFASLFVCCCCFF